MTPDLKTYTTPSCDFQIPEWLGDYTPPDIEQIEEDALEDEAREFYEWVLKNEEMELINFELNH